MRNYKILVLIILLSCGQRNPNDASDINEARIHSDSVGLTNLRMHKSVNSTCEYDNEVSSLGLGLVVAPSKFNVFNDDKLKDQLVEIDMYSQYEIGATICSKFFMPDYGIMHFVCLDSSENVYEVLSSYSTIKYLPNQREYQFVTWDEYILNSFGVRRLTTNTGSFDSKQPLKREPFENSATIEIPNGYEMFCPLKVQGDWVLVKYDCFYNQDSNLHEGQPCHDFIDECQEPIAGWIRWREKNKLIIDIFLMP